MVAKWMAAPILPLAGQLDTAEETVTHIKRRIYAIELYAGVTEEIVEGRLSVKPAAQRRRCTCSSAASTWMRSTSPTITPAAWTSNPSTNSSAGCLKPANLDRLLPMPRCIVSMRVRRAAPGAVTTSVFSFFINIDLDQEDKRTFLYSRNGTHLSARDRHRLLGEPVSGSRHVRSSAADDGEGFFGSNVKEIIDRAEFEALEAADKERRTQTASSGCATSPHRHGIRKTARANGQQNPFRDSLFPRGQI